MSEKGPFLRLRSSSIDSYGELHLKVVKEDQRGKPTSGHFHSLSARAIGLAKDILLSKQGVNSRVRGIDTNNAAVCAEIRESIRCAISETTGNGMGEEAIFQRIIAESRSGIMSKDAIRSGTYHLDATRASD